MILRIPFGAHKGERVSDLIWYWREAIALWWKVRKGNREIRRRIRSGRLVPGKKGCFYEVMQDGSRRKLSPQASAAIEALMREAQ